MNISTVLTFPSRTGVTRRGKCQEMMFSVNRTPPVYKHGFSLMSTVENIKLEGKKNTCGACSCQVDNIESFRRLLVNAHLEYFHGDASNLRVCVSVANHWQDWSEGGTYILSVSLCCMVGASHNQTSRGSNCTVASLFSFLKHHWNRFRSEESHLPDSSLFFIWSLWRAI